MQMKQWVSVAALVLGSSAAMAGLVQPAQVLVNLNGDGSGDASGALSSARFARNKVEYIGCGLRRFDEDVSGGFVFGFCQASTAAGVVGFCQTESPVLLETIGDQDDYSFVTFNWAADGTCLRIGNSTQSFYIPE
jgi:hypothetical protein